MLISIYFTENVLLLLMNEYFIVCIETKRIKTVFSYVVGRSEGKKNLFA